MKHIFIYIVYAAAFALAGSAAYYSVFGLSKLFSAQAFAVIIMASTLEISKLITASYLHQYWKQIGILLKTYLVNCCINLNVNYINWYLRFFSFSLSSNMQIN
jgi:Na+-translocating ferredoxin:NAD+ oxidoreductase RnfE subunit